MFYTTVHKLLIVLLLFCLIEHENNVVISFIMKNEHNCKLMLTETYECYSQMPSWA